MAALVPGQYLTRTSDAQILTVLGSGWIVLTFLPLLILMASMGMMTKEMMKGIPAETSKSKVGKMRMQLHKMMTRYALVWKICGVTIYALLASAIVFYWWSSNPPRTGHIVTFEMYASTLFLYTGMILVKVMIMIVMFHGMDTGPLVILLWLYAGIAIVITILTGISLFKYNTKPAGLVYVWIVFLVHAIYAALVLVFGMWYFCAMSNVMAATNTSLSLSAKAETRPDGEESDSESGEHDD